jgi:hypothetical protein
MARYSMAAGLMRLLAKSLKAAIHGEHGTAANCWRCVFATADKVIWAKAGLKQVSPRAVGEIANHEICLDRSNVRLRVRYGLARHREQHNDGAEVMRL